ncbi:MAG: 6-phosphofructokinase, partial [Nitrospinota bacterium]
VTKKTQVRMVDIKSESYRVARNYMVRLEKEDFGDPAFLGKLAEAAKLSVEEFSKRYSYLTK